MAQSLLNPHDTIPGIYALPQLMQQLVRVVELRKAIQEPVAYLGPDAKLYHDPGHNQPLPPGRTFNTETGTMDPDQWQSKLKPHQQDSLRHWHNQLTRANQQRGYGIKGTEKAALEAVHGLRQAGVHIHPSLDAQYPAPPPPKQYGRALFHSTPAVNMHHIKAQGLQPKMGGATWGNAYAGHSKGRVFVSSHPDAAEEWHGKTQDTLEDKLTGSKQLGKNPVVMLRVKDRPVQPDTAPGGLLGSRSHFTQEAIPPQDLEFFHRGTRKWTPIKSWRPGTHDVPNERAGEEFLPDA